MCAEHLIHGLHFVLQAYLHKPSTLPFIFVCIGIFSFDHFMRILKTRITTAIIRPIPELDSTRLEISKYNAGWRAGQHIRLRVLSSGMGLIGWAEVHPFTIASVSRGQEGVVLICKKTGAWTKNPSVSRGQEGVVLICKKTGTWTKNLYEIAKLGGYTRGEIGRKVTVVLEGPYGQRYHGDGTRKLLNNDPFSNRRTGSQTFFEFLSCSIGCRRQWNNFCSFGHPRSRPKRP